MDELAATGAVFSESGLAGPAVWSVPGDVRPLPASDTPEPLGRPLVPLKAASPRLSHELFTRLLSYGAPQPTQAGDVLFEPGVIVELELDRGCLHVDGGALRVGDGYAHEPRSLRRA